MIRGYDNDLEDNKESEEYSSLDEQEGLVDNSDSDLSSANEIGNEYSLEAMVDVLNNEQDDFQEKKEDVLSADETDSGSSLEAVVDAINNEQDDILEGPDDIPSTNEMDNEDSLENLVDVLNNEQDDLLEVPKDILPADEIDNGSSLEAMVDALNNEQDDLLEVPKDILPADEIDNGNSLEAMVDTLNNEQDDILEGPDDIPSTNEMDNENSLENLVDALNSEKNDLTELSSNIEDISNQENGKYIVKEKTIDGWDTVTINASDSLITEEVIEKRVDDILSLFSENEIMERFDKNSSNFDDNVTMLAKDIDLSNNIEEIKKIVDNKINNFNNYDFNNKNILALDELNESFIEKAPFYRQKEIKEAFEDIPPFMLTKTNEYSDDLKVDTPLWGTTSYYRPGSDTIYMDSHYDNDEYAEVFRHELGHFIDDKMGFKSESLSFSNSLKKDTDNLIKQDLTGEAKNKMLDEIFSNDDLEYSREISDILSAVYHNDRSIEQRYFDENSNYYHHEDKYWDQGKHKENEIFANMYSIYVADDKAAIDFIERYLPNTTQEFKKTFNRKAII